MNFKSIFRSGFVAVACFFSAASGASVNTPSVKVGQASPVTISEAETYYSAAANPGTPTFTYDPGSPEVSAMSASLRNDADLIFEYVHDRIEFVPLYGLQKGALGALIDKSGTAFDQAQLLVEMLRVAGHTANYRLGSINLDAAEFEAWFGLTDAKVACQFLADGGIPSEVNGNTSGSCTNLTGNVTGVSLAHIVVEGTRSAGGASFTFDPSFKQHDLISPAISNLSTFMNYTSGSILNTAPSATSTALRAFNVTGEDGVNEVLDGLSSTLYNKLTDETHHDKSMDDLLGGELIKPLAGRAEYTGYDDTNYSLAEGDPLTAIPNEYRALIRLDFSILGETGATAVQFYLDQVYGRRMTLEWTESYASTATPATGAKLKLDDVVVATVTTRTTGNETQQNYEKLANGNASAVKFTINHAYAASSGTYMDRVYQRAAGGFSQSVTFVFGTDGSGDALMGKLTGEHYRDVHYLAGGVCVDSENPLTVTSEPDPREIKLVEHMKTQIAYGWLSQFDRALDLQARAVKAVAQHHHSVGMAYTSTFWTNSCETVPNAAPLYGQTGSGIYLDVISGISVNQLDGSAAGRRATAQAIALAGATLEGSVFEQFAGKVHSASTTERYEWFNANASSSEYFRVVDATDWETINNALPAEEKLSGNRWFRRYADAGYIIIAAQGDQLGPGVVGKVPGTQAVVGASYERGAAFIAIKPDGKDFAHIVFSAMDASKGGGGVQDDAKDGKFDPSKIADILRDQFEDRSNLHGVNLASGQLTYSPPADLTTGSGKFPYALSFRRSYSSSGSKARGMGTGWTHNWDIHASASGSATEAMGASRPARAVPSLVAFVVAQDLLAGRSTNYAKDADTLKRVLTATFISHWWREHLQNNIVNVQQGADGVQFFKLPGEVFDAPAGSDATLEYVGATRRAIVAAFESCTTQEQIDKGMCAERYDYAGVTYRYTSASGDSILFDKQRDSTPNVVAGQKNPNVPQFYPSLWEFPTGVDLKFEYTSGHEAKLIWIRSNLGGDPTEFNGPAINFSWDGEKISQVTGTGLGSVTLTMGEGGNEEGNKGISTAIEATPKGKFTLESVTDLAGNTTSYTYIGNGEDPDNTPAGARTDWFTRLYEIYLPSSATQAAMRFTYDDEWRVTGYEDEVRIKNGDAAREAWAFYIAPGHRGERLAPSVYDAVSGGDLNPVYTVEYDQYGRAKRYIDEVGEVNTAFYDGAGRVVRRLSPEGNIVEFDYDTSWNVVEMRRCAANVTDACPADGSNTLTATAEYSNVNWPKKPTAVYDANQMEQPVATRVATSVSYDTDTGLPLVATLPTGGGSYSYAYNGFGQLVRTNNPENIVTVNDYDSYGNLVATQVNCGSLTATSTAGCAIDDPKERPKSTFRYDAAGNQIEVDGPLGTEVNDDRIDVVTSIFDAMRRETHVGQGRWVPLTVTTPAGISAALSAIRDNVIYESLALEMESYTETTYDSQGRPTFADLSGINEAGTAYGVLSTQQQYEDANGVLCSTGQAICREVSPDGAETLYTYDAMDRASTVTQVMVGEQDRTSRTEYDGLGRAVAQYDAVGTVNEIVYQQSAYTPNGQVAWVADANCNVTSYHYDAFDRLEATYFPPKNATNDRGLCTYDPANAAIYNTPAAYTGGVHTWSDREEYRYDANGNVIAKRTRAGDWILNWYNPMDRVEMTRTFRCPAGDVTDCSFAGVVTSYAAAEGVNPTNMEKSVSYVYRLDGLDQTITQTAGSAVLAGTSIPNVTLSYDYDGAARQKLETIRHTLPDGTEITRNVAVTHDAAGNRETLTIPGDSYAYTESGAVADTDLVLDYSYDYQSRLYKVLEAGDQLVEYIYDSFARRTTVKRRATGNLVTNYSYYDDGALATLGHDFAGGDPNDVTFGYGLNSLNQIVSDDLSNTAYRYADEFTVNRSYAANGLNQYDSFVDDAIDSADDRTTTLTYDDNGSLILAEFAYPNDPGSSFQKSYAYDVENRLVSVTKPNGSSTITYLFEYDPKGRRLAQYPEGGSRVEYLYDGDEPIADYLIDVDAVGVADNETQKLMARYAHGAGVDERLVYWQYQTSTGINSKKQHYLTNHQGSVIAMGSHNNGTRAGDPYTYDAWGVIGSGEEGGQPFRYTGRRWDEGPELYYYRARYYDADLGRFLQTDPVGYEDNMNMYGYVGNDPVNNTDPTGEFLKALKTAFNIVKKTVKNGGDIKGAIKSEAADIVQNVMTLADGELTLDDAFAAVDLITGFGGEAKAAYNAVDNALDANKASRKADNAGNAANSGATSNKAARNETCCFVAGTPVLTEDGLKNIEDIEKGEMVWAENPETGEQALKPIVGLIRLHDRIIWDLTLSSADGASELFGTTDDHPWWSPDRKDWVPTMELKVGEKVTTYDGDVMFVVSAVNTGEVRPTFNFEVADFHTYFVGLAKVLVHNEKCDLTGGGDGAKTRPTMPDSKIASEDGVTVRHFYKSGDHGPAHAHVEGNGPKTKIGPNGKPTSNQPELSKKQEKVVENNKSKIRSTLNKIGRILKYDAENN